MQGRIIKGIAGFYYVHTSDECIYECKAKGIFRNEKLKPLVGDYVEMTVLDEEHLLGNIDEILPRRSVLIRPAVANIDQALVVFALKKPNPNYNLLDRFLIMMNRRNLPAIICFNKEDIASEEKIDEIKSAYQNCGCKLFFISAKDGSGIDEVKSALFGYTTTLAGPSGVGKSSLINILNPEIDMETGDVSVKIERGKHTTRHCQLIALKDNTYILDTPGFSSLELFDIEMEQLASCYPEFEEAEKYCRFGGCSHIKEPDCGVKSAVADGTISQIRYENYKQIYLELKEKRKY